MKKFFVLLLAVALFAPIGFANDNDAAPRPDVALAGPAAPHQAAVGDLLWTLDCTTPTGDVRLLGVEFNGTNYFCTGAFDFTIAYLWEISPSGTVVNQFTQPTANWGGWGWRDLTWDGTYLYAGDPNVNGYIDQIDSTTGVRTGVRYGQWAGGGTLCRALGYQPSDDTFWFSSFSSSIYKGFKSGTYNTYSNPSGYSTYGMAMDDSNLAAEVLWIWSQNGTTGGLASEFDPYTGTWTGYEFQADPAHAPGGIAGGACAYPTPAGMEFCGMQQASVDTIGGYALYASSLDCDTTEFFASAGANINFYLNAGSTYAFRYFGLLASASGNSPGTPLPGGVILPMNWDVLTDVLIANLSPLLIQPLDASGMATVNLILPPFAVPADILTTWAFAVQGSKTLPWFASNYVEILIKMDQPFTEYKYDDGTCENSLGWTNGGDGCWIHYFTVVPGGTTVGTISTAFGCALYPGGAPGNGTPVDLYLWDDPNNDGDPTDCGVPLATVAGTVSNVDIDILNDFSITPVTMSTGNGFFVGCNQTHPAGNYVAPMDTTTAPYSGESWYVGAIAPAVFDPNVMANNLIYNMGAIGYPYYFLLRCR